MSDLSQAVVTNEARRVHTGDEDDDPYLESLGATAMTFAGAFIEPAIVPDETGDLQIEESLTDFKVGTK